MVGGCPEAAPCCTLPEVYINTEERRAYQREYQRARRAKGIYPETREEAVARTKAWREKNPERNRELQRNYYHKRKNELYSIKLERGCERCGYCEHPAALDFHHVDGDKDFNVAMSVRYSRERLRAEIAKCIVLCSNCHRVEHSSWEASSE